MVKKLPANAVDIRDMGSIPGLRRSLGGGHGNPLQYSFLENPMDRGAWWANVHSVTESDMTNNLAITSLVTIHHHTTIPFTNFTHHQSPFFSEPLICSLYLWVCFVLILFACFFFFRFHILVKSHGICISTSDLFHLAEYLHSPSMLLQMTGFCSFCVCEAE